MGKGKQSREGQALRRKRILDYIREKGPVKGTEICRDLEMSRSSLSDDIRGINTGGEIILSPTRGTYVVSDSYADKESPYSRIDRQYVRRWMILLLLFGRDRSYEEIMEELREAGTGCTKSVLYNDLAQLQEAGMITPVIKGRRRLYHSDSLYETDSREIRWYADKKPRRNARINIAALRSIDLKIKHSFPAYEQSQKEGMVQRSGKSNILTEEQIRMLQDFEKNPFKEKELSVTFRTNSGHQATRDIRVGIIVYVVETARVYLIGAGSWKGSARRERTGNIYSVIPMDQIISVTEGKRRNTCYNTPEFHRIYREMFQISAEDPVEVRVRFQNLSFIRDKIERLCRIRETASMVEDGSEIIFTDTLRGQGDFARYLRRFGRSAIVEAPESLREQMMETSRKVIDLYS